MQLFTGTLGKLKKLADDHAEKFESDGFATFFDMIKQELNDEYFQTMQYHLKELEFKSGILVSSELGDGNTGVDMILRKPNVINENWLERLFAKKPPSFMLTINPRDEAGTRALNELENKGLNFAANALAQSVDHILSFWKMLRAEVGFYIGCLNLNEKLEQLGEPVAFPVPLPVGERRFAFHEMYDVCLSLTKEEKVVGNDAETQGKDLVIITGANQGGKSTFLRSVGLSMLMMQCGMYVPAESYTANVCTALFTHYKREEDSSMSSGKLDEELSRMSDIVEQVGPNAAVFFNESFAATNEREGSEIARQVVEALLENHIQVFFVTHFYELAYGFYRRGMKNAFYLRAQRQENGDRTFRLAEGEPLQTSFGEDLYKKVFEEKFTA
jgi:DNA mismatch repair ATPase MutS